MSSRAFVVALTLAVVVAGCGAGRGRAPSAAPTTSSAQTPAALALARLLSSVADLGAVEIRGGTTGSPLVGRRSGISDLRTGDFSASISLGRGLSLKMLRHADLTWSKAPPVYWTGIGYTEASARAARDKWVVGAVTVVTPMIEAMDPGAVVRTVLKLTSENLVGVAPVTKGPLRGNRVLTFAVSGTSQRIYFTAGDHPRLVRVTSTKAGATTWVDFVAFRRGFRTTLPRARDVLQGR